MTEGVGTWFRQQRFGHILLQTYLGEVYSLDLYQISDTASPDLSCRGFYLPPAVEIANRLLRRWEAIGFEAVPKAVPVVVELAADSEAFNEVGDMFRGEIPQDTTLPPYRSLQLSGPERGEFYEMYAEVSPPIDLPGRTVWAGRVGGKGDRAGGEFTFVLEQYGTIEPVLLLLVILFFLVFLRRESGQDAAECYRRAVSHCGARNIKSVNVARRLTGATFRVETECHFECHDPPAGG